MVGRGHLFVQTMIHDIGIPVIHVEVLHHLEVGNGHAARIAEEIGDHMNAVLVENFIRLG